MSIIQVISYLWLLANSLVPIDGFGVEPKGSLSSLLSEKSRRRSLRYQNEASPTSAIAKESKAEENNERSYNDWDLREDWALQDSVPTYTVGTEAATFWTQLRHSTPELAKRSEAELEKRYSEWYSSAEDSLLVQCGPSPLILSDWEISSKNNPSPSSKQSTTTSTTTIMSGSLPNGSRIWFLLKCAGTLGDDSKSYRETPQNRITQDTLDDCFISASLMMHMSGYAESTGGVVYELGAPRCEAHKIHRPRESIDTLLENTPDLEATNDDPKNIFGQLGQLRKYFVSEASKNVGTISAIVAAFTMTIFN